MDLIIIYVLSIASYSRPCIIWSDVLLDSLRRNDIYIYIVYKMHELLHDYSSTSSGVNVIVSVDRTFKSFN